MCELTQEKKNALLGHSYEYVRSELDKVPHHYLQHVDGIGRANTNTELLEKGQVSMVFENNHLRKISCTCRLPMFAGVQ